MDHDDLLNLTTYVEIDLDAIAHNVAALKAHVGPTVEVMAVVKANAYGHGAVQVARVALESGASGLATGPVPEGIQLRRAGFSCPIWLMTYAVPEQVVEAVEHDLTVTVNTPEVARALSGRAVALGRTVKVHVKVDTGMGRFGLLPEEVVPFVDQLAALPGLDLEGIYTHFATADWADKTYTRQQFAIFREVLEAVELAGHHFRLRHAANSAATLDLPETHLDAVRPGIAIYGLMPSDEVKRVVPLRPALSLKSHVGRVRTLPAGASVSYGRTFIAERPTPVALVPLGYGDGYHRLLSNRGAVLIGGRRAPIVGRVCMDQFVVDVTGIEGVAEDDEVVLIGEQGGESISADEVAAWAETINYEVTTGLLPRATRVYLQGGRVVDVEEVASLGVPVEDQA
jgi:alanine racemase